MAKSSFFLRLLVACLFLKQQFVAGEPSSDEVSITITMENNAHRYTKHCWSNPDCKAGKLQFFFI